MAAGDLVTVPVKGAGGIEKNVLFEEQADGSLSAVNMVRGAGGAAIATQATAAAIQAALEAQAAGTDASPVVSRLSGSTIPDVEALPVRGIVTTIEIGGITYLLVGGNELRGTAANRPTAADAAAAVAVGVVYWSVDVDDALGSSAFAVSDGTNWVAV